VAASGEVKDLRREVRDLKILVPGLIREDSQPKESMVAVGGNEE
jgi:hypothetical protein